MDKSLAERIEALSWASKMHEVKDIAAKVRVLEDFERDIRCSQLIADAIECLDANGFHDHADNLRTITQPKATP